jgi:hypothetical protein
MSDPVTSEPDYVTASRELDALFASLGITTAVGGARAALERDDKHTWPHVAVIVNYISKDGKVSASFDWRMGTGLVDWKKIAERERSGAADRMANPFTARLTDAATLDLCSRHLGAFIAAVNPAEVLARVLADGEGACRVGFEDWASEFGYDTDSRKAERIYMTCQEQGRQAARLVRDPVVTAKLIELVNQL